MLFQHHFLFVIFFLFSLVWESHAQKITGRVINQADQEPLAFANVFLNNTQKGATTDENGNFEINDVAAGNYELLASYLGFKTYYQTIQIKDDALNIRIELIPQSIELKEIVVTEDKNWKYNYETFLNSFLGQTPNRKDCKIMNPDILRIVFDADSSTLKVKSKDFLIIENQALGYKIKYLLQDFRIDYKQNLQYYWGYTFFEELKPKNQKEAEKWKKKRAEAFLGSTQHFMKAVYNQNYETEGFLVYKLRRVPNPNRKPESEIRNAIKSLTKKGIQIFSDTMKYWANESKKPKIIEILNPNLLPTDSISVKNDSLTILKFEDYLQIVYKNEKESFAYLEQNGRDVSKRGFQTSLIYLSESSAVIESNGILKNPLAVIVEGYWGWQEKIAEILPFDYVYDKNSSKK